MPRRSTTVKRKPRTCTGTKTQRATRTTYGSTESSIWTYVNKVEDGSFRYGDGQVNGTYGDILAALVDRYMLRMGQKLSEDDAVDDKIKRLKQFIDAFHLLIMRRN